jgi:uncharacterized membrane protein (DUF2068 family)
MQNTNVDTLQRRPGGVTLIAVLLGIEGILEVIIGILILATSLFISHRITVHGHTTVATVINVLGGVLGGLPLIVGILTLIFTWGLWMLKRWAFWTTIVIAALNILVALPVIFQAQPNIPSFVIRIIVPVLILIYFLLFPQVRHAFHT